MKTKKFKSIPNTALQFRNKNKFLLELKEAVEELNLVLAGKKKVRNAKDFLSDL